MKNCHHLHCQSVSDLLANTVTKWSRITPSRENVRELFKEIIGPDNVRGLDPVRINDVIYQALPFKAKISDQHLRGIKNFLLEVWVHLCQF